VSKTALQDIQRSLNAIRKTVSAEDARIQMAALQLLLGASESIVQLARKMDGSEGKAKRRTQKIAIPQTKVVKQKVATQNDANATDGREKRDTAPTTPQAPLTPQQQRER